MRCWVENPQPQLPPRPGSNTSRLRKQGWIKRLNRLVLPLRFTRSCEAASLSHHLPCHAGVQQFLELFFPWLKNRRFRSIADRMNQKAEDLLMGAPLKANDTQLKDLNIKVVEKKE